MLVGNFVSNCLSKDINYIKFAALYYDEIHILENTVYTLTKADEDNISVIRGVHTCVEEDFILNIKMLEDEGVVKYQESEEKRFKPVDANHIKVDASDKLDMMLLNKSYEIMHKVGNKLFELNRKNSRMRFLSKEVEDIHSTFINDMKIGAVIDFEFLYTYYVNLIYYILKYNIEGKNVITSSDIVNSYFHDYQIREIVNSINLKSTVASESNLGMATIKQLVPNVSMLSMEEILDLRYKCRDELINYRYYMNSLNEDLIKECEYRVVEDNIEKYINNKINPALKDFEGKITKSNLNLAQSFLDEIKDIRSYTPLIGSVFMNLPEQITLLLSAGLIGAKTFLNFKEKNIDIKNNGLYYLYKLSH